MILIPEIETVVILVPRTGSGSLRRAIAAKYPRSMMLYRHMEADGVPHGYDRWPKIGVVREPLERLWSLYKFCQALATHMEVDKYEPSYVLDIVRSTAVPFSEWITDNRVVFTDPYDRSGAGRFFPRYTVRHPLPENIKSQFMYLRPDLGTRVYRYAELRSLETRLGVKLGNVNETPAAAVPPITMAAARHIDTHFSWDLEAAR